MTLVRVKDRAEEASRPRYEFFKVDTYASDRLLLIGPPRTGVNPATGSFPNNLSIDPYTNSAAARRLGAAARRQHGAG